jgi:hypothetical protein
LDIGLVDDSISKSGIPVLCTIMGVDDSCAFVNEKKGYDPFYSRFEDVAQSFGHGKENTVLPSKQNLH